MAKAKVISYSNEVRPEDTKRAGQTISPSLYPSEAHPQAVDFAGSCPRCKHAIQVRKWLVVIAGARRISDEQREKISAELDRHGIDRSEGDETFDLVCCCNTAHPKAPEGKQGCGASFRVRVVWP